ncbi:auxin response factor 19-like protein isoform X1 [Tanacetum coccineum]|uniref:Auxin response factor 19-like protein isoform X1 n=1 Tax=Tanacetum coccineum TaxID=301880 RepID=A0ABQ5H2D2_9ASTR
MKEPPNCHANEGGEKKIMNTELWQACAGPLVNLPAAVSVIVITILVVAASMKKGMDAQIQSYPNLQSKLLCILRNVTLHADPETDEVYAQMTLQPVPADFAMQPPAQELVARDLHDCQWTFRHIFRGQPKRHLLTTGWSLFVSGKRLCVGDSVLFIRDHKQQLLLGIRRATTLQANLSSSVLTSDSMHIGVLAAAAHAAANNSNVKYVLIINSRNTCWLMQVVHYAGLWAQLQVGWDESTTGEKPNRVLVWEIKPVTAPFYICPTPFYGLNHPRQPGITEDQSAGLDNLYKRPRTSLGEDTSMKDGGLSIIQWMNMQQSSIQPSYMNPSPRPVLQNYSGPDVSRQMTHDSLQFNGQRSITQLDQVPKLTMPSIMNPLISMMQPQQQMPGLSPQTTRQNVINQSLPQNLGQSQIQSQNVLLQQSTVQNHQQQYSQSQRQSQCQQKSSFQPQFLDQQQLQFPDQQQLQVPENQVQPLQKLHHQPQSLLAHQDQQKPMEMPRNDRQTNMWFPHVSQKLKLHHQAQTDQFMTYGDGLLTAGHQSGVTNGGPSCSTSPSKNDGPLMLPSVVDGRSYMSTCIGPISDLKPLTNTLQSQNKGFISPQSYLNHVGAEVDYLDSSSSGNSVCVSQNDHLVHPNSIHQSFNTIQGDPETHILFGSNKENHLGLSPMIPNPLITERMMESGQDFQPNLGYENPTKDNQAELSSSTSFGVPDMTFNSIDSIMNGHDLLNSGVWALMSQPFQRMRTYTKVYKRGAVGRSIDIAAFSGYRELKEDLTRRFGIEGQLEDRQRIGWKLVYVDHENDVLLVGDDPWEEFVSCVHCIKILSPQEVQQMSLDGNFGRSSVLPDQACSSSDM